MTSRNNLHNRVVKASNAKVVELFSNAGNKFRVYGSRDTYRVVIERSGGSMRFECTNENTGRPCKGNGNGTVCYHSMAVAAELASRKEMRLAFCANKEHAELRARINGRPYMLVAANGNGGMWVVASDVVEIKVQRLAEWRREQLAHIDGAIAEQERIVRENGWSHLARKVLGELIAGRNSILANA